jgi:hypothetical protein
MLSNYKNIIYKNHFDAIYKKNFDTSVTEGHVLTSSHILPGQEWLTGGIGFGVWEHDGKPATTW